MDKSNTLLQQPDHSTSSYNNKDMVLIKPEFFIVWVTEDIVVEGKKKTLLTEIYYRNWLSK